MNVSNITPISATLGWTGDGDNFNVTYAELPDVSHEYKYDNGVYENCIPNRYAGVLLPANSYTGSNVRKISVYDSYMAAGAVCQLWICYGTTAPDMENAIYTDYVIYTGTNAMMDIPVDVAVDKTKNLWVVMRSDGDKFSLPACTDHSGGDATANGRWYSEDGSGWTNNDYWEDYYVWIIRVTLDGGGYTWSDISSTTNSSYNITGLSANKDYAVRVRKVCGGDDGASKWSGTCFNTRTKVFTAENDSDWATASNWAPPGVPTINDNVVISDDATIGSGCVAQAHQITFEGTPTPTLTIADGGQLVCNNPANVTVQKAIEAYGAATGNTDGWNFIASPITEAYTPAGSMVANTYDLYRLNPANTTWENFNNSAHSSFTTLDNGQGYLYANSADVTLNFTGTTKPYDNSYSVPLSAGFNLVGNPYTFDAYVNCCYFRMNTERTGVVFVNENYPIPPCESVVVKATADSSLVFTNVEQPWQDKAGHLNIVLSQAVEHVETPSRHGDSPSTSSGTLVLDKAMVSFDEGVKLGKFYFGTQDANIYIPVGHEEYAIAYAQDRAGEMPLNFKAHQNGEFTLSFDAGTSLRAEHSGAKQPNLTGTFSYLHLIDNLTGSDIDLLATPSYTFTARTTDYASRFRLVFNANGAEGNDDFAFIDGNGNLIVTGDGMVQIIDMMGRILVTRNANDRIGTEGLVGRVYVLRLINGDHVKTQKIVIR